MTNLKKPTVTIGLPCFNAEDTLDGAIRSIFMQNYQNWELILVDDGSTDRTLEMMRAINDSRVKVLHNKKNRGLALCLNQISQLASGIYLARMDGDDLMFPNRLDCQVKFLEDNQNIDLVGAAVVSIDLEGNPIRVRYAPMRVTTAYRVLKGEVLFHPVVTGRIDWFRRHPYSPDYPACEDFALWVSNAENIRLSNLQEPLLFYRDHGVFSYDKYLLRTRDARKVLKKYGFPSIGLLRTWFLVLRRMLKDSVYCVLYYTRLWPQLFRFNSKMITSDDMAKYKEILNSLYFDKIQDHEL